ncbi:hypothetical protein ACSLBF_17055 [Pseudoalteromonas sp. T1lg65]|uniref:hypothetical protein n=1 Tax=Pseudoalteromonas sp. T1lg65 TaxID=2077101 RepID=UPI003F7AC031
MKKIVLGTLFLPCVIFAAEGDSTQKESMITKSDDETQFCYYADNEFSEGARHFQVDEWKICTKAESGFLVWKSAPRGMFNKPKSSPNDQNRQKSHQ